MPDRSVGPTDADERRTMSEHEKHLMTRRRSLALFGAAGAGLLAGGTDGRWGSAYRYTHSWYDSDRLPKIMSGVGAPRPPWL